MFFEFIAICWKLTFRSLGIHLATFTFYILVILLEVINHIYKPNPLIHGTPQFT